MNAGSAARTLAAERFIGRLLIAVTYVSVGLLLVGAVLMIGDAIDPRSGGPNLNLATFASRVTTLKPDGYLWLGLLAVIAAPIGRVIVAGVAYARDGDRLMVGVSIAILLVIAIGIGSSLTMTF